MADIDIRPGRELDVPLELEDVTRKAGPPLKAPRLSLGEPVVVRLTKKLLENDRDAKGALSQSADHVFDVVRLACTFRPSPSERFTEAWLQIRCKPASTIAWSMLPQRDADLDEGSTKVTVGAGLKLIGVKAGAEETATTKRVRPFIDAFNLQQSDPEWQFKPTSARELQGSFPLAVVLRSLADTRCSATIRLRCVVEAKKFGLFTYASSDSLPELNFAIHK